MAWNLNLNSILSRWVKPPKPGVTDDRFLALTSDAKRELDRVVPNIEDRLADEGADFQDALNATASYAVQRAWFWDPSATTSESQGVGPFSKSVSKDNAANPGIYFTQPELDKLEPADDGRYITVVQTYRARPNFSLRTGETFNDRIPVNSWGDL